MRPFHPSDLPGMYRVCLATGDAGGDATALYRDPELLAHVYCGPYPVADPGLTFVVVDEHGVAGYVVATADTEAFAAWCEASWWPALRERLPLASDPGDGTRDHELLSHVRTPPAAQAPEGHPAHLHVDVLPRLQGQGWGRRLIAAVADALRARGVPGLHLVVDARNTRAVGFYEHVGLTRYASTGADHVMVLDLH